MSDIAAVGEKRVFEPFDKEAFREGNSEQYQVSVQKDT